MYCYHTDPSKFLAIGPANITSSKKEIDIQRAVDGYAQPLPICRNGHVSKLLVMAFCVTSPWLVQNGMFR